MHTDGQADISNSDVSSINSGSHSSADAEDPIDLHALRAEVTKWQERVPKLAKALRERSEELAQAREELRTVISQASTGDMQSVEVDDARLQARNDLINDLQAKITELGGKHRQGGWRIAHHPA